MRWSCHSYTSCLRDAPPARLCLRGRFGGHLNVAVTVVVQVRGRRALVPEDPAVGKAEVRLAVVAEDDHLLAALVPELEPVVAVEHAQLEPGRGRLQAGHLRGEAQRPAVAVSGGDGGEHGRERRDQD